MDIQYNIAPKSNLASLVDLVRGTEHIMSGTSTVIGRSSKSSISLLTDKGISQRHAEIILQKGNFCLRDLKSKSGTAINGKPIWTTTVLQHGDIIRMGRHHFRFQIHHEPSLNEYSDKTHGLAHNYGLLNWFHSMWYNMTKVEPRRVRLRR